MNTKHTDMDNDKRLTDLENQVAALLNQRVSRTDIMPGNIVPQHLVVTTTPAQGDMMYGDGTVFKSIPIGSENQVLTAVSGAPAWQTPATPPTPTIALTSYTAAMTGGNQTITTTATDIASCTLTLAVAGTYLVLANIGLDESAVGTANPVNVSLVVNGVSNPVILTFYDNSTSIGDFQATVSGQWVVTTTGANQIAKLQVLKPFNTGTFSVIPGCTQISAVKLA